MRAAALLVLLAAAHPAGGPPAPEPVLRRLAAEAALAGLSPAEIRAELGGLVAAAAPEVAGDATLRELADRALGDALSGALPPGLAERTYVVGPFRLTREEILEAAGPREGRDRRAVAARLAALDPAHAAQLTEMDVVRLVPLVVAAAESTWQPPGRARGEIRAALGPAPDEPNR